MAATLRQAVRSDIPAIQRVRHAVKENRLTSTVITDGDVAEAIERTGRGWVIDVDGSMAGFAIGNAATGNLWALFVDPVHEGQGYGRRLHDACLRWLCGRAQTDRIWLTTEPDTRAHRFYLQAGWMEFGRRPDGEVLLQFGTGRQRPLSRGQR